MNTSFSLAALCAACALALSSCSRAPAQVARLDATAPTVSPSVSPSVKRVASEQTFRVSSPATGATLARQTPIRGTAPSEGARVQVAIQPDGGQWYEQNAATVGADGSWSVPGYFGGDDTPEGFGFNVRARLIGADGTLLGEQIVKNLTRTNRPISSAQTDQATAKPVVMGYYPSYRAVLTPSELRPDRFTDIIYSFAKVDETGALDTESYAAFPAFVKTVHAKKLRAILGLSGGGNGDNFGKMVRDEKERAAFVAALGELVKTTGADGFALDWEQPEPEDKPLTTKLVRELRAAMKAANPDAKLIMVVNASAWSGRGYDGPALRDSVDYLHIMSYDFHGPWNHAGHHTNLFATSADKEDGDAFSYPKSLQYWHETQGFPSDKILMGIVGYGRGFRAPNWGAKTTGDSQYPEISYADIQNNLIGHGWTRQWDSEAHAPWLLSDDKTQRISYDDKQSVADKAAWIKSQHLPGFFIWEMVQEEVGGDNELTAAALNAWEKAPAN